MCTSTCVTGHCSVLTDDVTLCCSESGARFNLLCRTTLRQLPHGATTNPNPKRLSGLGVSCKDDVFGRRMRTGQMLKIGTRDDLKSEQSHFSQIIEPWNFFFSCSVSCRRLFSQCNLSNKQYKAKYSNLRGEILHGST